MSLPTVRVVSVSADGEHRFSKPPLAAIDVVEGFGVVGDAHAGPTVQHRFLVEQDPSRPNLRQVHLIDTAFLALAAEYGFEVGPGDLGENITTENLDPLALPLDTRLHIGPEVVLRVTGLRNPCHQLDGFRAGLMAVADGRDADHADARLAGLMAVAETSGRIRPGDAIRVVTPPGPHHALPVV